jgi:hypothetical protein
MKVQRSQPVPSLILLLFLLQRKQNRSGGYTLVITIAVLLVLSVLLITYAITSKVDNVSSTASAKSNTGFFTAEAGLNRRAEEIRAKFVGYGLPKGTSPKDANGQTTWKVCIQPQPGGNTGTEDLRCQTDSDLGAQPVSTYVEDLTNRIPVSTIIPQGDLYAGLSAQDYRYNVISITQDKQAQPTAILGMKLVSRLIPLFQFAAFYNQTLDFSIPPNMTLNGLIHSNDNLYLDANSGSTLSVQGRITTKGAFYRGARLPSASAQACNGVVKVLANTIACGGGSSLRQYTQANLNALNNTDIRVGVPTLITPPLSQFDAVQGIGNDYWNKADLRIVLNLDSSENPTSIEVQSVSSAPATTETDRLLGDTCAPTKTTLSAAASQTDTQLQVATPSFISATAKDGPALQIEPSGTTSYVNNLAVDNDANVANTNTPTIALSKQVGLSPNSLPPAVGSVVRKATVWTSNTFWNYRDKSNPSAPTRDDAKQIRMLNVDMQALMTCANQLMGGKNLNEPSEGGLVWFFTVKGPNSNNNVTTGASSNTYGVRLYNGASLKSTNASDPDIQGLTVVSDQAIYVRGDYNSVNKKPAAIMADTINVLSNAWPLDDAYSRTYNAGDQSTGSPVYISSPGYSSPPGRIATDTTINAAFLSGIDLTGGGLNNFPRLHEDWQDALAGSFTRTLTYRGSMVSLGLPRRINSPFCESGANNKDCNVYNPPFRNWDYDTAFNNAANLPPITPRAVYLKQEIFSRSFEQALHPIPSFWAIVSPTHWFGTIMALTQARK